MVPLGGEALRPSDGSLSGGKAGTNGKGKVDIPVAKLEELRAQLMHGNKEGESSRQSKNVKLPRAEVDQLIQENQKLKQQNEQLKVELVNVKRYGCDQAEHEKLPASSATAPAETAAAPAETSPTPPEPDPSSEPLHKAAVPKEAQEWAIKAKKELEEDSEVAARVAAAREAEAEQLGNGTASDTCPAPELPSGSYCVLFVPEAPDKIEMGMANRMHRMADALVSVGMVVHVVVMQNLAEKPTTMPGMHVHSGTMKEQWEKALEMAGKQQLRLGVVFSTMITVRLRKDLGSVQRNLMHRLNRRISVNASEVAKQQAANQARIMHRLNDTSQAPFTDGWPEESAVHWLSKEGALPVMATDDVHFKRAPLVLQEAGLCEATWSCPAIGKWLKAREMAMYKSVRTIFTVSDADKWLIDGLLTSLIARQRAAATSFASTDPCEKPRIFWIPYVDEVMENEACAPFEKRQDGVVYLGGRHAISEIGVHWLLRSVQPEMRRLGAGRSEGFPGHVYLVGPGWDQTIRHSSVNAVLKGARATKRATIEGLVSDEKLHSYMQRYKVLAAPVFNMTGVATKNIHALASGMPLVTTTEGLRGLGLPQGQEVVYVRDNATEFAKAVLLLQSNASLFHLAQTKGLAHARRTFTTVVQAEKLCAALGCKGLNASVSETWEAWRTVQYLV